MISTPRGRSTIRIARPTASIGPARSAHQSGQTIVEFAIISVFFLLVVLGTIDFGRAIYLQSQLENGVREAAREARTRTANGNVCGAVDAALIEYRVRHMKDPEAGGGCGVGERGRPGLGSATVDYDCDPTCTSGARLTIEAALPFRAVAQEFLGIDPFTLTASASVTLE